MGVGGGHGIWLSEIDAHQSPEHAGLRARSTRTSGDGLPATPSDRGRRSQGVFGPNYRSTRHARPAGLHLSSRP